MQTNAPYVIARPDLFVTPESSSCEFAAAYHRHHMSVVRMAGEQTQLVKANRSMYDYYYDHLSHLSENDRMELAPEVCKIVKEIEAGAVRLNVARANIQNAFCDAAAGKMTAIGAGMRKTNIPLGERYIKSISIFRSWRIVELDGKDVDLLSSLDLEKDYTGASRDMFGRMFAAWCNATQPGMKIAAVREEILAHIAVVYPNMVPNYTSSLASEMDNISGKSLQIGVSQQHAIDSDQECEVG